MDKLQVNNSSDLAQKKQLRPLLAIINEDYPKIKNVANTEEKDSLINYLNVLMNIKASSEQEQIDLSVQMIVILDFINFKFGFLTIPEIKEAFKMYVAKDFGHKEIFRNLDTILVSDVLNCYVNFRADSLRSYNQNKEKLKIISDNKISDLEKEKILIEAINNKFNEFLNEGTITEPIIHIFDDLIHRKIIKMPDSKTVMYYNLKLDEATKQISKELRSITSFDKKEKQSVKDELEKILNKNSKKVEVRAKKLVLIDFFTKKKDLGLNKIL